MFMQHGSSSAHHAMMDNPLRSRQVVVVVERLQIFVWTKQVSTLSPV